MVNETKERSDTENPMTFHDWVKREAKASFLTLFESYFIHIRNAYSRQDNDVTKVYHFLLPGCSSSAFQPAKMRANTQSTEDSDKDS